MRDRHSWDLTHLKRRRCQITSWRESVDRRTGAEDTNGPDLRRMLFWVARIYSPRRAPRSSRILHA